MYIDKLYLLPENFFKEYFCGKPELQREFADFFDFMINDNYNSRPGIKIVTRQF